MSTRVPLPYTPTVLELFRNPKNRGRWRILTPQPKLAVRLAVT
ncbi:MAG: hypothetical protein QI199_08490 [Candidatus Korarchaeota archaeon]|nr:hypothetical protein [Candidatus Korarchaeota archaeon]